ncbi:Coronatine-insensitive protein 1 [Hibiscus syriacus]|uniref:Coronatine-insensitive protein 1 n=1 Tax=Hibiscus syriacus TaxID=106335 RepID=A0A6A2XQY6_HIBSY|nr:Coronatine-insensitive protein 1 [Hibiscus syriacus]
MRLVVRTRPEGPRRHFARLPEVVRARFDVAQAHNHRVCYTTTTDRLRRRFPFLESLKLKGKPRAAMFNLIPDDWGGYVTPWVREIAENFDCLRSLHFRRMIVRDSDLEVFELDESAKKQLRTLFLEESAIIERDGEWLHEIAMNNSVLETLNFYMTDLVQTRNVIGDTGLEVLAQSCKKLKRLRIERGADEQGMGDEEGAVSHRGLTALAQGCLELEYIAIYVSDITNASLESIGTYSKNLCDFRLKICTLSPTGGLTDVGLGYIGRYSPHVRWMLLGYVGGSDTGLLEFSKGCPSLQKLEMRGCCFSERALAHAALQLPSLRYLWVQGYKASSQSGRDLLAMARPFWNRANSRETSHYD